MATEGLYVGSGEARRFVAKSKLKKPTSFLKFLPIIFIALVGIAIIGIFVSGTLLGPHLSALITEATQTDYTAYNIKSNELMIEILEGKQSMPDSLKSALEKEGIKVENNTLNYKDTIITADNFMSMYNGNVDFREAIIYSRGGRAALFYDQTAQTFYRSEERRVERV